MKSLVIEPGLFDWYNACLTHWGIYTVFSYVSANFDRLGIHLAPKWPWRLGYCHTNSIYGCGSTRAEGASSTGSTFGRTLAMGRILLARLEKGPPLVVWRGIEVYQHSFHMHRSSVVMRSFWKMHKSCSVLNRYGDSLVSDDWGFLLCR